MGPKFNTSFIPKKSLQADTSTSSGNKYISRRTTHGPGFFLMLLIFIACVIASVGVFGYTAIVERSIEEKKAVFEDKKKAFDETVIDDLIETDSRIANASTLLGKHLSVSQIFNTLEKITLKRIQYTNLTFTAEEKDSPTVLTLVGVSDNFQDVALQTREYRSDKSFHLPVVKELEKVDKEIDSVEFGVETVVDSNLILFSSAVNEGRLGPVKRTPTIKPVEEVNNTTVNTEDANAEENQEDQ